MIKKVLAITLVLFAIVNGSIGTDRDTVTLTVIASGETHAMLGPCDCPVDPGGGLAERATVLKKSGAPADRLLLDAGGFGGGGIYDDYTGGRAVDSLRTLSTLRAMGAMKYDAAAIGDDDLIYGGKWLHDNAERVGLPLISSNCFATDGSPFVPSYKIIVKNGVRFGVVSLTTEERLFKADDSCTILPPVSALKKIWGAVTAASDCPIILSHLGEAMTKQLVDSFPGCGIIVNGHRKTSSAPVAWIGKTLVMQFGFEGKKLSYAKLSFDRRKKSFSEVQSGWIEVSRGTLPDTAITALLDKPSPLKAKPVYDLYIMSNCPYGCAALREFIDFVKQFPDVEWNLWFIGNVENDSLVSLHGPAEAGDEMTWLAVKTLYPGKWLEFLRLRGRENAATSAVLSVLSLDTAGIGKWVRENGRKSLADHYERSMRLHISASPTLLINNSPFEKNIESRRLAKGQCLTYEKQPALCGALPECFDDGDCRKKGFYGSCNKGKCGFSPDAAFTFSILVADSTVQHPENAVRATTEDLFPAATIEVVTLGSKRGRELYKKWAPTTLPLYIFGEDVAQARNFSQIASGLVKITDGYTFKNAITPVNYFPGRVSKPGEAVFLVDPFFPDAINVLRTITDRTGLSKRVRVLPVINADPAGIALAVEEKLRQEEALRWMVMDSLYRERYFTYLSSYAKTGPSSYWFLSIAIQKDLFVKQVKANSRLLAAQWDLLQTLGVKDPVSVLLNNREIVIIRNEKELASVLDNLQTGK
jgi:hypothetical protein